MAIGKNSLSRSFFLILVFGLSFGRVEAASQVLATCDDCSSSQHGTCATHLGHQFGLAHGSKVWIVDFVQQYTTKFELEVYPPGTIIYGREESPSGEFTVIPVPESLTSSEQNVADLLIDWVNQILRPNGGGYAFTTCPQSSSASNAEADGGSMVLGRGAVAIQDIIVPPDAPWVSAYEIIGNTAAGIQLANMLLSDIPITQSLGVLYNFANNFINVLPVNLEAVIRMKFPDGSLGQWDYNAFTERWEANFATFHDSDGNPIPMTPSDMTGRAYLFSGQAPGQENLDRFLQRAQLLGIPITGPGGGSIPTKCEMVGDRLRCSPISGY